jgi:hypothetical protein
MKRLLLVLALLLAVVLGGGYVWLQRHSTQSLRAGIEEFRAGLPEGARLAYDGIETAPLESSATFTDLRLESPGGHVFAAARFTIGDVTTDTEGRLASIGRFAAEDARLELRTEIPTRLLASRFDGAGLRADVLQQVIDGDLATWPTLARFEIEDLRIEQEGNEEYVAARAGVAENIADGRIGRLLLRGFEALEVDDAGPAQGDAEGEPRRRLYTASEAEFRDLDIAFFSHLSRPETRPGPEESGRIDATFRDLVTHRDGTPGIVIGTGDLQCAIAGDLSLDIDLQAEGLHMPVAGQAPASETVAGLRRLGYDQLKGRFEAHLDLSAQTGALGLDLDIDLSDAGVLALSLDLSDVPPLRLGYEPEAQGEEALKQTRFDRLVIDYADDTLMRRVLEAQARARKKSYPALQDELQASLAKLAAAQTDESARASIETLATFFRTPDRLHIRMEPRQPVPLGNAVAILMLSPVAALKLLNVQISRPDGKRR